MEGTSTEETLLKKEIEDLPVVIIVLFRHTIGRHKADYRTNLRCHVVSSYGGCTDEGCTDEGCTVNQVGPIHMSDHRPTLVDCLRQLNGEIQELT
jgi:hypothetical protein